MTHGMVHAYHVGDTWHACIPCRIVQSIKIDQWRKRKKRKEKEKEKKGRKEDLTASSSEFWNSDCQSTSGPELKLAMLQEVGIFPTLVNFYLSVV